MLHKFVTTHRARIIERCRSKAVMRSIPPPSKAEVNHGVPLFLDQLVDVLRTGALSSRNIDMGASRHGRELLLKGLSLSQVVYAYGDICQAVSELAVQTNTPFSTEDFKTLNQCLDD